MVRYELKFPDFILLLNLNHSLIDRKTQYFLAGAARQNPNEEGEIVSSNGVRIGLISKSL